LAKSKWEVTMEEKGDEFVVTFNGKSNKSHHLLGLEALLRGLRSWGQDIDFKDGKTPKTFKKTWFLPNGKVKAKINPGKGKKANVSKAHLDDQEVEELLRLFEDIKLDLSMKGFPTRTNRLSAVENMARVLEIHDWNCIREQISENPSKKAQVSGDAMQLYRQFNGTDVKSVDVVKVWLPDENSPLVALGEGRCPFVGYESAKTNEDDQIDQYIHHFGEEGGKRPKLYVTMPPSGMERMLIIYGGDWDIEERSDGNLWLVD